MRLFLFALSLSVVKAFLSQPNFVHSRDVSLSVGYVPDGVTPDQYKKLRENEAQAAAKKNFGAYGPQSFKSRSLQSFQKDLEAGKASHLMPVTNAKEKLKKGLIKQEDIPYMQRLGSWDDSDLGKKKKWREEDKKYAVIQNQGVRLNWAGGNPVGGPAQQKQQQKGKQVTPQPQTKKLFGLF